MPVNYASTPEQRFSFVLRNRLTELNITQAELCRVMQINSAIVSGWVNAKALPTIPQFWAIVPILFPNTTPEELARALKLPEKYLSAEVKNVPPSHQPDPYESHMLHYGLLRIEVSCRHSEAEAVGRDFNAACRQANTSIFSEMRKKYPKTRVIST